jgi:hypothetical protein
MKVNLLLSILILSLFHEISFASFRSITWKGTYYQGIPNKNNISNEYCKNHTPGTFFHSVNNVLAHGIKTDKGIRLDHATFHEEKRHGLYFISGDLIAHGRTENINWDDHIYYYLYKLTENGLTQGVWRTKECKGLYAGVVVNKN